MTPLPCLFTWLLLAGAPQGGPWDVESLEKSPSFEWREGQAKVRSLFYTGEPFQGRPTRVFAYYASPATLGTEREGGKKFPGMVLVHGGMGHAYSGWVETYAKRGYAAIAMDLAGHDETARQRLPDGGPEQKDDLVFQRPDTPDKDHWTYHAVADVILAHSLLRGFAEVDPDRTGVIGISWGGYLTCIVAGLDRRFRAAATMYGCGFLRENSYWSFHFEKYMKPAWAEKWSRTWDPSIYVGSASMPMFFVNAAGDSYYPIDSFARTFAMVKHPGKAIRIEVGMRHGHIFDQKECLSFFDHHLKGGPGLPRASRPKVRDGVLRAAVENPVPIVSANLHWTTGPHKENKTRTWGSRALTVTEGGIQGDPPPAAATVFFVTVKDERGILMSSEPVISAP
jgi:dienelactone hydrolase